MDATGHHDYKGTVSDATTTAPVKVTVSKNLNSSVIIGFRYKFGAASSSPPP
jgi:hypothetical protein